MACRCIPRLLATTAASSCLRALPAFSASASYLVPDASASCRAAARSSSFEKPEARGDISFARLHLDETPTRLRVNISESGVRRFALISSDDQLSSNVLLHYTASGLGLQILARQEIYDKSIRCFSTKISPSDETVVRLAEGGDTKPKTLEDFQHEEITGPTVERDLSPVADELRESLDTLQRRILSFQKSLFALGCVQIAGAVWCHVSWHALDPTWQLLPPALLSFTLAFVLRQALQPISFFGKLEERSRLRIITLSLMISKGFASFFNRARILVAASVVSWESSSESQCRFQEYIYTDRRSQFGLIMLKTGSTCSESAKNIDASGIWCAILDWFKNRFLPQGSERALPIQDLF